MPRDRLTFRQRDIAAAIRAVEQTGNKVARVEIGSDGCIKLELASSAANEATPDPDANPWNEAVPDDYWKRKPKRQ
jgi:hypothetical protein